MNRRTFAALIILFTLITGLFHLAMGARYFSLRASAVSSPTATTGPLGGGAIFPVADDILNGLFVLNGVGYILLLIALFGQNPALVARRDLLHNLLSGYAGLTILAWVLFDYPHGLTGYLIKADEVLLVVALWAHGQPKEASRRAT